MITHKHQLSYPGKAFFGFFVLGILLSHLVSAQDIRSLLPANRLMKGWQVSDSAKVYKGDDLFTLIDGGADLYLEYGFNEVVSCKFANLTNATLQVEIYKMTSDTAAYGIFSTMQSDKGQIRKIGQDARMFDYYLVFWKSQYFVTITGSDRTVETRKSLEQIALLIDSNLKGEGSIPAWTSMLPTTGLQEQKYIRGNIGLSNIYSFGPGNMFNIREGVHGKYKSARVFLFRYNSDQIAVNQFDLAGIAMSKSNLFKNYKHGLTDFTCIDGSKNNVSVSLKGNFIRVFVYTDRKEFKRLFRSL